MLSRVYLVEVTKRMMENYGNYCNLAQKTLKVLNHDGQCLSHEITNELLGLIAHQLLCGLMHDVQEATLSIGT